VPEDDDQRGTAAGPALPQEPARQPDGGPRLTRRGFLAAALCLPAVGLAVSATRGDRAGDLVTRCRFGAYAANEPYPVGQHAALEADLGGTRLPVASWFQEWGGTWPTDAVATLAERGEYDVLMCLEGHGLSFAEVLAGEHDDFITGYVTAASASTSNQVVIRLFHEANSDWYDWAPAVGSDYVTSAEQWQDAWRHVVTVARSTGVDNVRFFFCVNNTDVGGTTIEDLWPGEDHVDVIGCDGYSWNGPDTSFDEVHADAYARLTALHPTAEYWIGETGLDQQDGSAGWYRDAYRSQRFPRLTTACWFSAREFALTGDPDAVDVHRAELPRAPQYTGPA